MEELARVGPTPHPAEAPKGLVTDKGKSRVHRVQRVLFFNCFRYNATPSLCGLFLRPFALRSSLLFSFKCFVCVLAILNVYIAFRMCDDVCMGVVATEMQSAIEVTKVFFVTDTQARG